MRTVLALLAACLLPGTAHAGRSFYGWLYGTEVMPERGVELQTWVFETNDKYGTDGMQESSIWWGPQIGITDQLELSLPIELYWSSDTDPDMNVTRPVFTFRRFGIEARYRLAVPDPVDAPPVVPLVRLAVKRDISARDNVRIEADLVASYEAGAVHLLADLGFIADTARRYTELRPSVGLSIRVAGELRLGAEGYSELSLDTQKASTGTPPTFPPVSWAAVGPNLSWTHGRFWLSATFGIGVYHIRTAPRVMWGVAF